MMSFVFGKSFDALGSKLLRVGLFVLSTCAPGALHAQSLLTLEPTEADFVLSSEDVSATLYVEPNAHPAVSRAVSDLAQDMERVTDRKPAIAKSAEGLAGNVVIVAVLGQSPLLDHLIASGKLSAAELKGRWESYLIQVIENPFPQVARALVIAGSDKRGAIYGVYELSESIGVSPWYWWADVPPAKHPQLAIASGTRRYGPPSVKYRGVFLNDEDWGLQPWAAKTFEPEAGNLGPKTYARLFELMLRLKANTVWPAMHPGTTPFNGFPENKQIADQYGIVMGSSHAEPMLRNNVGEWTAPKEDYNYLTNRSGVLQYWEKRMRENGRFENIYTLGMRGIHDSNMQGPRTDPERIQTLEKIFNDQRALISKHVTPQVEQVPQIFCAYKEVLDLYRKGLRVPDDVTIVWPDDNFGYVRNVASAEERTRSGGFGVYYHLSYLGHPLSYLWLSTTPPALIWEEMHKAYEHGADRIWIANVGDLKPAEIGTEFFLQMAWNIDRWSPRNLADYLPEWCLRAFGPEHGAEIAALLATYYHLNYQRKPEHLQWWLPREPLQTSTLTDEEVNSRLDEFARLKDRVTALKTEIPAPQQDAFFELVYYPIVGASLANARFFEGERGHREMAVAADEQLKEATRVYNREVAGGKWRGMMSLEPADAQWASMRIQNWTPPEHPRTPKPSPLRGSYIALDGGHFETRSPNDGKSWTRIPGLGRTGSALAVLPTTFAPIALADAPKLAPQLLFPVRFPAAGTFNAEVQFVPTHPISGTALKVAVSIDDAAPQLCSVELEDGGPGWAQGVLNSVRTGNVTLTVPTAGEHTLRVFGIEPGIAVDKIVIDLGGLTPTYLGPTTSNLNEVVAR